MDRRLFLSTMVVAGAAYSAPLPPPKAASGGVLVLDDCDEAYSGKAAYEDNLTFLDASGKLKKRVSGLNICQEIGSPHRIAVDPVRKNVWVAETVGHRLLRYDLEGKELSSVADVKPGAIAIDPGTGNAWVLCRGGSIGTGMIEVYNPKGERIAKHSVPGYDIAYDGKSKAFQVVDRNLVKVSLEGKVLSRQSVATWCAVSVAVDQKTGTVWLGERKHPQVAGSTNQLKAFTGDGKLLRSVAFDGSPCRIAIDPSDSSVWIANSHKSVLRYSENLETKEEFPVAALTLDVKGKTGNVWVVTKEDTVLLDRKGKVLSRTKHKARTLQAWIASW